jgi:hypothetical protein
LSKPVRNLPLKNVKLVWRRRREAVSFAGAPANSGARSCFGNRWRAHHAHASFGGLDRSAWALSLDICYQ